MLPTTIAHTVCLHNVTLESVSSRGDDCCDSMNEGLQLPKVNLEPIVVLRSIDSATSTGRRESIIEQYTPLRSLLQYFCRTLLVKQYRQPSKVKLAGAHDMYWVSTNSSVSGDGLFIQVPSCSFVSECVSSASSGVVMDVVNYNSLISRWYNGGDGKSGKGDNTDAADACDEGYIYGYLHFISTGHAAEGLLLTILSMSPLFNLLRTVVMGTVPHVVRAAREVHRNCRLTQRCERSESIASFFVPVMSPLSDLVDPKSAACAASANRHFSLRFSDANLSVFRPDDLRLPFIDVPMSILLLSFSYDALRVIHSLLLQEKRVVFIGVTPQHASACVVSVQAILLPFIWTLPLVPYMPPEACDIFDALRGAGFIVGSTADIVPHLMLHGNSSGKQLCANVRSRTGSEETDEDRCRIWFADARTGRIGVSPCNADCLTFAMLNMVPPSDKLKEVVKKAVSKDQRLMFRMALTSSATQTCESSSSQSSRAALMPCPPAAIMEEVDGAFLEYNIHRLVGNYRKGMFHVATSSVNSGTYPSRLQGKSTFVIDYRRFLPGNLDNDVKLARCIAETRLYRHWEDAVMSMETIGVMRSLLGEFVRSRARSCQRRATSLTLHGKETLATHYYLSNQRMIGMMCLFYSRSSRRFPELYADLQVNDLAWLNKSQSAITTRYSEASTVLIDTRGSGKLSGNNNSNNGSQNGKGLMRTLFSKATKAVKNSLVTHHHGRIPVQVFVQAYGSFGNKIKYEMNPSELATSNKEFKNRANVVSTSFAQGVQQDQATLSPSSTPSPGIPTTYDLEDDLYGTCSGFFTDLEDAEEQHRSGTSVGESGLFILCRRIPLDAIHHFNHYHTLLDPTRNSVCLTGRQTGTTEVSCKEQLQLFMNLGLLFATYPNILRAIEQTRLDLFSTRSPTQESLHHHHHHHEEQQQQLGSCLPSADDDKKSPDFPFQPQPLPFSMDLVTGQPQLPPLTAAVFPSHASSNALPSEKIVPSGTAVQDTTGMVSHASVANGSSTNVMDALFSFPMPQKAPENPTNRPMDVETFFIGGK